MTDKREERLFGKIKPSAVLKLRGLTRRQAAVELGVPYVTLSTFIYSNEDFRHFFIKEGQQSTNQANGLLFEDEGVEGEDLDTRPAKCLVKGCTETFYIHVEKSMPIGKEPKKMCGNCKDKDHEYFGKGAGISKDDQDKIRAYDPDKRVFLEGLDGPVKTIKGKEFEKLAAQYLPSIKEEAKTAPKKKKRNIGVPLNKYGVKNNFATIDSDFDKFGVCKSESGDLSRSEEATQKCMYIRSESKYT